MLDILNRIGGPNGITWPAWLVLAPISIFLTQQVVPEGLQESPVPAAGLLVGTIGHLVVGLVLLLGKSLFLRSASSKPRPITTLLIMAIAGIARGFSVSYSLELFGLVDSADYFERMRSGAVLIIIWFSVAALVIDSRSSYRASYQSLYDAIESQLATRQQGEELIQKARNSILEQIKATLRSALVSGASSRDLHNAVDELVRPLSHRLALETQSLVTAPTSTKRRIRVRPVIRSAFSETAFNPLITAAMSIFGTVTSLLWTEGPIALVGVTIDFFVIVGILELAQRLKIRGPFVLVAWFVAGFASAAASDLVTNPSPWSSLQLLLYLSVNVMVPAALFAFLAAYQKQAQSNLGLLRENLALLELETHALSQSLWIERKRLARFVHSELQSRLRAFALRLEFEGKEPTAEQMSQLRAECEAALVFDDEAQSFERFIEAQRELWAGVTDIQLETEPQVLDLLSSDRYACSTAIELVREGITNAVKHGKAGHIKVLLSTDLNVDRLTELRIEVRNDGEPLQKGPSGLGSSILSELAPSYTLTSDGNETVLRMSVVIRQQAHLEAS